MSYLLLLLFTFHLAVSEERRWNTAFFGKEGTFIVSVDRRIDPEIKKKIAKLDGAQAYNEFLKVYGAYLSNPRLLSSADGVTQDKREKKNKQNFLASLTEVKSHNREYVGGNSQYELTMNTFAVMDDWEKSQYLGGGNLSAIGEPDEAPEACRDRKPQSSCYSIKLNDLCTEDEFAEQCEQTCGRCGEFKYPDTLDWNARGYVTQAKDQKTCGSCWTFSAVGVMEWIYKKTTGNLVQLSEQELLDCTYEEMGNRGCLGGWPWNAWDYVREHERLASNKRYPYANSDTDCFVGNKRNMRRQFGNEIEGKFRLGRYVHLPVNRDNVVRDALNTIVLAVGIYVSKDTSSGFYQLGDGIFDDCPPGSRMNHAVTLTGYGPNYWEIKNSWGIDWGRNGFGKLQRGEGINMCSILNAVAYVEYEDLDDSDGEEDFPREPVYDHDRDANPDCFDNPKYAQDCPNWASHGFCHTGDYIGFMNDHCKLSCDACAAGCEAGYFRAPGPGQNCVICAENSYSEAEASSCTPCSVGSWSEEGSTSVEDCNECEPGYHLSSDTNRCVMCPADTYSNYGATACTSCPEGSRSAAGSESDDDCVIPPTDCEDALPQSQCEEFKENGHCLDGEHLTTAEWGCKKTCAFCEEREACVNKYSDDDECDGWYAEGYCNSGHRYEEWMSINCKKSCGLCSEGECIDYEQDCDVWASYGYCHTSSEYHDYMVANCKQSCGLCTEEQRTCSYAADTHNWCGEWKQSGYCSSSQYQEFMRTNCATTCRFCPAESGASSSSCRADDPNSNCAYYAGMGYCTGYYNTFMTQNCATTCGINCLGSSCSDNDNNCAYWASIGECTRNPYYMNVNCKSSCNQCGTSSQGSQQSQQSSNCYDSSTNCASWAYRGECSRNPNYMNQYCRKSCNLCGGVSVQNTCRDTESYQNCAYWRSYNWCYYYGPTVCRRTCQYC